MYIYSIHHLLLHRMSRKHDYFIQASLSEHFFLVILCNCIKYVQIYTPYIRTVVSVSLTALWAFVF